MSKQIQQDNISIPIKSIQSAIYRRDIMQVEEFLQLYWDDLPQLLKLESSILIGDYHKWSSLNFNFSKTSDLLFWFSRGELLMGNYQNSIKLFQKLINNNIDSSLKLQSLRNLGNAFSDCEYYKQAENYFNHALNELEMQNSNEVIILKGKVFTDICRLGCRTNNLENVEHYGKEAIKIFQNENDPWREQIVIIEILKFFESSPNIINSLNFSGLKESQKRVEKINKSLKNTIGIMSLNFVKALRLINESSNDSAIKLLNRSLLKTAANKFNFFGSYEISKLLSTLINTKDTYFPKTLYFLEKFKNEKKSIKKTFLRA